MKKLLKAKEAQENKMIKEALNIKEIDEFYFDRQLLRDIKTDTNGMLSKEEETIFFSTLQWLGTQEGIKYLSNCGFELRK
jgi:hypothetical protein